MLDVLIGVAISSLLVAISMPGYLYGGFIFIALVPLFLHWKERDLCFLHLFLSSIFSFHIYQFQLLDPGFDDWIS